MPPAAVAGTNPTSDPPPPADSISPDQTATPRSGGRLKRRGLLIGAVAAALVVVLAVVYAVSSLGDTPITQGTPSTGTATTPPSSASPSVDEGPLPARMMMTAAQSKNLVAGSWKVVTDTTGVTEDSVTATCLGRAGEGEPAADATRIRTLAADDTSPAAVFHQVDLYPTPADAIQAMTTRTAALGTCSTQYALLQGGAVGTNLGNSAIGVTVIIQDTPTSYHTVMINRTGRLVNVIDVASEDEDTATSITLAKIAKTLGTVTDQQCSFAVGLCATNPSIRATVPPIGDTPGLLSVADVPRVGTSTGAWTPGDVTRKPTVTGSNCEATSFGAVTGSTATLGRTYILADDPGFFGFDTVLVTMANAAAATKLASDIEDNVANCNDRLLTATVSDQKSYQGTGLRGAEVSGSTFVVSQKIDQKTTLRYRVGIGAVGNKVVYSFANPKATTDFTDDQWSKLNVRMGERATQVT